MTVSPLFSLHRKLKNNFCQSHTVNLEQVQLRYGAADSQI